jgi:small nuclear ribonucleoprotein (snRNP)-like protein
MDNLKKALTGALLLPALALAATTLPAAAQTQPAQNESAQTSPVPSYAQPGDTTIRGVVRSVDGKYNITVRDANGYVDNVTLHDGTVINPTGLTLAPGESVTIEGQPSGGTFTANEIDTPYLAYGPYGYPAYPYAYGAYPAVAFGFGFRHFGFGGRF